MARFWLLIVLTFLALLITVTYVSRRSSQVEVAEERQVQRATPPEPARPVYQAPRSYSPAASSNALYKCVDAAGNLSFQSQACASDATQAWVRDATPEPEPSAAELRRRARADRVENNRSATESYNPGYSPGPRSSAQGPSACQIARSADAAYRAQRLRYVTHDGLRRHGDRVNSACH